MLVVLKKCFIVLVFLVAEITCWFRLARSSMVSLMSARREFSLVKRSSDERWLLLFLLLSQELLDFSRGLRHAMLRAEDEPLILRFHAAELQYIEICG